MYKFNVGDLVQDKNGRIYEVEDTSADKNKEPVYLLKEKFPRYSYNHEYNLQPFKGVLVNDSEIRQW